jgi:fructuronate reductase
VPNSAPMPRLSRALTGVERATPRIVHLGLGGFHRSHQAWWTDAVDQDREWGITAFTGRSPQAAVELAAQDGLFTLIERSDEGDTATVVSSIADAVDGADVARLSAEISAESTALVTLTITEAGYRLGAEGHLDTADPEVAADIERLRRLFATRSSPSRTGRTSPGSPSAGITSPGTTSPRTTSPGTTPAGGRTLFLFDPTAATPTTPADLPRTAPGRLLAALEARRRASGAPIALVSCDNLPGNAGVLRTVLTELAEHAIPDALGWLDTSVSYVSTSVDRITPHTVEADRGAVEQLCGWSDHVPVVAEPFHDWVLSGDFPLGRPAWEDAGARFVDDIEPWELRKLLLLNGAHSIFATAGRLRGHQRVSDAVADDACLAWVFDFWDEATRQLPAEGLELDAYREALLARFGNTRIAHSLAQIAAETSSKLRVRFVPVALAERAAGRNGHASAVALAGWVAGVAIGLPIDDSRAGEIAAARRVFDAAGSGTTGSGTSGFGTGGRAPVTELSRRLLRILSEELSADGDYVDLVTEIALGLLAGARIGPTE